MRQFLGMSMLAVAAFVFTGCTSTRMSQYSAPLDVEVELNKVPKVTVGPAITGQATVSRVFFVKWGADKFADGVNYGGESGGGLFSGQSAADLAKEAAAYNACKKSGADVILVPRYTVEINDYLIYETATAKVKGFKGKFNGFQKK